MRHDGKKEKGDKDEACGKGEDEGNKKIKGQEDAEERNVFDSEGLDIAEEVGKLEQGKSTIHKDDQVK